ncbi:MAG: 3-hydroxyacyl-CoA dehydrogenase family protein [Granulosicoccus sp.]
MSVARHREAYVGYVEIAYPTVYIISSTMRKELLDAVRWAEKECLDRVIFNGKGVGIPADADVCLVDSLTTTPRLSDVLNAIEESFVPWIAAIEGVAHGGAAQIAMACRMRIMSSSARIGLPDVTLGVVPSAGGTQRLPRLVGLATTLDMICGAKILDAKAAFSAGLVNEIDDVPVDAAFMVNTEELGCLVPVQELPAPEINKELLDAARNQADTDNPGQIAPLQVIDVIERGLALSFHEGLAVEWDAFVSLRNAEQAIALRHVLHVEHNAKPVSEILADTVETSDSDERVGVVGKRILERYREAADTVLMDGSTPWEIDEAMVEFGYAMGPYSAQDLIGLDIAYARRQRKQASRDPARRYIPIADRMIELGKLGRKTGAGWYRYPGGGGRVDDPIVADLAIEEAHFAKIERVDYSADEIRERLLLAMINEAADILLEGITQKASDIDLITIVGYGFPRWRGGLMHFADTLDAKFIVTQLERLSEEDRIAWQVSPLLKQCAEKGIRISDVDARQL